MRFKIPGENSLKTAHLGKVFPAQDWSMDDDLLLVLRPIGSFAYQGTKLTICSVLNREYGKYHNAYMFNADQYISSLNGLNDNPPEYKNVMEWPLQVFKRKMINNVQRGDIDGSFFVDIPLLLKYDYKPSLDEILLWYAGLTTVLIFSATPVLNPRETIRNIASSRTVRTQEWRIFFSQDVHQDGKQIFTIGDRSETKSPFYEAHRKGEHFDPCLPEWKIKLRERGIILCTGVESKEDERYFEKHINSGPSRNSGFIRYSLCVIALPQTEKDDTDDETLLFIVKPTPVTLNNLLVQMAQYYFTLPKNSKMVG